MGLIPSRDDWLRFVDRLLIILGVVLLIAGIFFFFAFNWADLPRFGKFALVQTTVVIAAILALMLDIDTWGGRLALMATALLVGTTFAVVGQAYQTGADSYQLFLNWTLLITGLVLISRWNMMYFIWMVLLNLTITLYWWQVVRTNGTLLNIIIIAVNYSFVIGWDVIARVTQIDFMQKGRWFLYLLMLPVIVYASTLMLDYIFGFGYAYGALSLDVYAPYLYVGLVLTTILFYTRVRRDLQMLAMGAFSILVVVIAAIGHILVETIFTDGDPYIFLMTMGLITISLTIVLVYILRYLQDRWEGDTA